MAIDFRKELIVRYVLLSKSVEDIEKKIKILPEGRIKIKERNGNTYYYLADTKSADKYLGPNDDVLIEQLIQKDYLNKVLKDAKAEQRAIAKMLKLYPDSEDD